MSNYHKRHASKRLKERYGAGNPGSLLFRLEQAVLDGKFTAEASYPDSTSRGTINLDGDVFEVVINNQTSKIITVLPKGSMNEDRTKRYQGRR